ncbi:hypothetical protein LX64_03899 [Chitinophaga skermanii]|uniref:Uncharacterized protein n=1 Tax=Chitinophaga skermanii TaxID=331697 RepID=A0A327QBM2_9BACT|nr:hypothetical protein [Chitinophaga skermanii]RAJ01681.1 hypothetical protein LX64_03899 [Chitinophaga skermanii]
MLLFKNRALKVSLMATAMLGILATACNDKDDNAPALRSKEYAFTGSGNSAGKVTISEKSANSVQISISLDKSTKDTTYNFNIFKGEDLTKTDTAVKFTAQKSTGAALLTNTTVTTMSYDSALKLKAFAKISFKSGVKDSVVATKKIGAAATN